MKKISTLTLAGLFAFMVTPVVVLAQSPSNTHRPDTTQIREQAQARAEEAKTSVEERKSKIMAQVEERRAQIEQDVCERRQQVFTSVMPRLAQGATSVKQSMDTVYSRVVGFYVSGQLTVENYDELVGDVEAAKANAESAITTIDQYQFELDCDNPNVGEQLDGFRLAVGGARDALKAYQGELVDLISAMRAAASLEQEGNSSGAASDAHNHEQNQGGGEDE